MTDSVRMTDSVLLQTIDNLKSTLPELEEQERRLREQLEGVVQRVRSTREALEHLRVLTGTGAPAGQSSAAPAAPDPVPEEPGASEPAGDAGQDSPGPDAAAEPEAPAGEPGPTVSAVPQPRTATSSRAKSSTTTSSPAKKRTTKKTAEKTAAQKTVAEKTVAEKTAAQKAASEKAASEKTAAPKTAKKTAKKAPAKKATAKATKKAAASAEPQAKKAASKRAATDRPADERASKLIDAALAVLREASAPMRAREINAALGREATPGQIESVRNTLDRVAKQQKLVTRPGRGTYAAV
ncbi:hypothetical protein AB0G35_15660 [Streptomyces sp. NPDC021749]|uniref:hypothetical protein n=1 Tax=Streptomyces sp. NPDC021749 TaxID=3154905 RepID=UPI0033EACBFE